MIDAQVDDLSQWERKNSVVELDHFYVNMTELDQACFFMVQARSLLHICGWARASFSIHSSFSKCLKGFAKHRTQVPTMGRAIAWSFSRLQDGDPWDVEFLMDVQKLKAYADLQQDSRLEQVEAFLALGGTHFGTPRASEASEWLSVPPTLFRWPAETETVRTVEFDQIAARTRSGTTENRLFCASGHGPPFHS